MLYFMFDTAIAMKKLFRLFSYLAIAGILLLVYSHLESRWIKTKRIEINSNEIPDPFNGKTIVFITDIHHGPFLSLKRVKKLVARINKLEPDLILMGGDYVHRRPEYIAPLFDEFQNLQSVYGIYAVLGNHDHWESAELTKKMMARNGIKICDNTSYWLRIGNAGIKIGGVGDLWEDTQSLDSITRDIQESDYSILISHNPDYIEQIDSGLIDLTLSGHTHGGQVTLFGLWAPIVPSNYGQKYRYGLHEFENTSAYISSGVGTITPPVRFFCRPEIVLITLKNKDSQTYSNPAMHAAFIPSQ